MNLKLKTLSLVIIIITTINSSHSITLYPEPNKHQIQVSYDTFNIRCPASHEAKNIYLCALKTMKESPEKKGKAKEDLIRLSSQGILDAKYSLFARRKALNIRDQEAVNYLVESAEGGLAVAQMQLGKLYLDGDLFKQDLEKSYKWMKLSAEGKNYEAMRYLSKYYFSGEGTKRNDSQGFYWLFKLYSDYGPLFDDWDMLGAAYETGRGTPVDLVKAYMCYDLEGTAGIEEKARIAPKMTPEQRAEGLRLSREWQEKNHVYTMQSLGLSRQKDGSYR